MPVSTLTNGVIGDAGVDEGLELAEHLAAADLDRADLGDARRRRGEPPVVSRSTTTKVVARSGSPSSSKLGCAARRCVMSGRVGRGSDETAAGAPTRRAVPSRRERAAGPPSRSPSAGRARRAGSRAGDRDRRRRARPAARRGGARVAARDRPVRPGEAAAARRRRRSPPRSTPTTTSAPRWPRCVAEASPELTEAVRDRRRRRRPRTRRRRRRRVPHRPDGMGGSPRRARTAVGRRARRRGGQKDEVDRLRTELAELRAHGEGRADAGCATRWRRPRAATRPRSPTCAGRVRDRTRELRAAERERDAARAAGRGGADRAAAPDAAHEAELRRLRGRASPRPSGRPRRPGAASRTERDVDDARLWLLVDTLVQAAERGAPRTVSAAARRCGPADAVGVGRRRRPAAAAPPIRPRWTGCSRVPNVHVVIDGYNVTKTGYGELSLTDQRDRLIGALAPLAGQSGAEITVAFDGGEEAAGPARRARAACGCCSAPRTRSPTT